MGEPKRKRENPELTSRSYLSCSARILILYLTPTECCRVNEEITPTPHNPLHLYSLSTWKANLSLFDKLFIVRGMTAWLQICFISKNTSHEMWFAKKLVNSPKSQKKGTMWVGNEMWKYEKWDYCFVEMTAHNVYSILHFSPFCLSHFLY